MSSPPPPPTQEQVLHACATAPLPDILSALAACPDPPHVTKIAEVAVEHDRIDLLRHLLATGTPTDYIPRKAIVRKRSTAMLQALLDAGWDINDFLGGYMGCALTLAILCRAPDDFVKWLLDRGADPNGPPGGIDHCGYALRLAVQMLREGDGEEAPSGVARMLLERGANVDESRALHMAAENRGIAWVRWLVEEGGADVNAEGFDPDWAGSTEREKGIGLPLHYAARSGNVEIVKYLLEKGADVTRKDTNGRTPKEVAERLQHDEAARILTVEGVNA
ncbi:Potassium channel AKT1 [Lasiodiplodia theobromae]|uniref:Potassium channel AKT1 n=1 Tax=Lasiodiplodia theobromae TaxID=45133 RepID=A0A5N5D758_9PEZI|nr:Potassium channel AKT1 [Lasiodiplodia theobromae]